MKKKLKKLNLKKEAISSLTSSRIIGGGTTYTCQNNPMTSCDGNCSDDCASVPCSY